MRVIACALQCEAQAFIDFYKMKSVTNHTFKVFQKDDITLVISGIGKLNMAAACAYVYAKYDEPISSWLNIGICGADNKALGEVYLANKIHDPSSTLTWYPPLIINSDIPGCELITTDHPTNHYSNNNIYDMEASGFYSTCIKFTTAELVTCLKVVSDNAQHPTNNIDKNLVLDLMKKSFDKCIAYFDQQADLLKQYQLEKQFPNHYSELVSKYRFTKTQQHQLKRALECLKEQTIDSALKSSTFSNSKQVLLHLNHLRSKHKVSL